MQNFKKIISHRWLQRIDWNLLVFLILFLNVKMPVKIAALFFLLLLNRKLFLEKTIYHQKFIWFYFSLIAIALINVLINIPTLSVQYLVAVSVGIMFWLICIGAAFLNSWFVKKTDTGKLHATITLFFFLNTGVTLVQLIAIMLDAGSINPYTYQGMYQKYFIGTGDLLKGITLDVSTTNAVLNAFGIVYFIQRSKMGLVLLCMATLLLTASNFTNVLLLFVFAYLFIFQSNRNQKSIIVVCFFLMAIFMIRISPQNNHYVAGISGKLLNKKVLQKIPAKNLIPLREKPDSILSADERKQKIALLYLDSLNAAVAEIKRKEDSLKFASKQPQHQTQLVSKPFIPKPEIHSEPFQKRRDTTKFRKELLEFGHKTVLGFDSNFWQTKSGKLPGKLIAFQQTFSFFKKHPLKILTGAGIGNFSSKLAFRATGLEMAGGYPKNISYINENFLNNHLSLYLNYFSKDIELHSLINNPNSVYDQLMAEYGVLGCLVFILLYFAFFVKPLRKLTYGIPLLLILLGSFWVDYWFEQLSIVILFELLMLLNIKESNEQNE